MFWNRFAVEAIRRVPADANATRRCLTSRGNMRSRHPAEPTESPQFSTVAGLLASSQQLSESDSR